MLDSLTKKKIDDARDILVGKVPVPQAQVEQITIALIYKFMYDMDVEAIELGGNPKYFTGDYAQYAWNKLLDKKLSGDGRVLLYQNALTEIPQNASIPRLFRDIFKNAFLPYRDPETLNLFLKCIDEFTYDHSERLGDAFEYLLAILGSQGDAGQFRTPRHIIDFIVALIDPQKEDVVLDPACGTAGFLISAYKHILKNNSSNYDPATDRHTFEDTGIPLNELIVNGKKFRGDKLSPAQKEYLHKSIQGYDISFDMVRLSLVNMYLHGFNTPQIHEYDTLTSETRWGEHANVILANPPFMTPKGGIKPHTKFTIKANKSEALFVDYIMEHLTAGGRAGIIVPEGIIFKSDKAYKQLRKALVENNHLVGVISLPSGVFNPYAGVKTSILWLDKSLAKKTDKIIFLKVNADGYDLGAQRRPIDKNDLPAAFAQALAYKEAVLTGKEFQLPEKDVILVEKTKLAESGDYNLSGERYCKPLMVSSSYRIAKLSEVAEINPSVKHIRNLEPNSLVSFLPMSDLSVNANVLIPVQKRPLSEVITGYTYFEENDILLAKITPCFENGKIGIVTGLSYGIGFGSTEYHVVRCGDKILPKFLYHLLNRSEFRESTQSQMTGSAGQKRVPKHVLEDYSFPLPPLSVQEEIVAELDSYQKIIDGAKQVVDNWKPRIDIDPEWSIYKIRDICSVNPETQDPSELYNDWFTYIDIASIDNTTNTLTKLNKVPVSEAPSRARRVVKPIDVIISTVRPNLKAFYFFDTVPERAIVSTGFAVIRAGMKIQPKFLYYMLLSDFMVNQMISLMGKGSYPSINQSDVMNLDIPLPDYEVQKSIANQMDFEAGLVEANRKLIKHYNDKSEHRIEILWNISDRSV